MINESFDFDLQSWFQQLARMINESFDFDLQSWFQQLAGMINESFDFDLQSWFQQLAGMMEVVHKTCCFDLYLFLTFLQGHKNFEFFARCTMNGGHFVDTITH